MDRHKTNMHLQCFLRCRAPTLGHPVCPSERTGVQHQHSSLPCSSLLVNAQRNKCTKHMLGLLKMQLLWPQRQHANPKHTTLALPTASEAANGPWGIFVSVLPLGTLVLNATHGMKQHSGLGTKQLTQSQCKGYGYSKHCTQACSSHASRSCCQRLWHWAAGCCSRCWSQTTAWCAADQQGGIRRLQECRGGKSVFFTFWVSHRQAKPDKPRGTSNRTRLKKERGDCKWICLIQALLGATLRKHATQKIYSVGWITGLQCMQQGCHLCNSARELNFYATTLLMRWWHWHVRILWAEAYDGW